MQQTLGELLGIMIVVSYVMSVLNYVLKAANRRYRRPLEARPRLQAAFKVAMRLVVRRHKRWGIACVLFLTAHFLVQFSWYGLNATGLVAAGILLLQAGLGIYGAKTKGSGTRWLAVHRLIALALPFAMLVHIL